jgi:hypothetical protein
MLYEGFEARKFPLAQVALVRPPVPGFLLIDKVSQPRWLIGVRNTWIDYQAPERPYTSHDFGDIPPPPRKIWTCAALEMKRNSAGRSACETAIGTLVLLSAMNGRVEVVSKGVATNEFSPAEKAVVMV